MNPDPGEEGRFKGIKRPIEKSIFGLYVSLCLILVRPYHQKNKEPIGIVPLVLYIFQGNEQ